MRPFRLFCLTVLAFVLSAGAVQAAPTFAFGYLQNKSGDRNYQYLESLFPNTLANSLGGIFKIKIIKNKKIEKVLAKYKQKLKKDYKPHELPELCSRISADYFIYGSFRPLGDGRIRIVLNMYVNHTRRIFSFTNNGMMEVEIFKLVDRISQIIVGFLGGDTFYKAAPIPAGSRLAVLTNASGEDLNLLYHALLSKGYGIAGAGGNTLESGVPEKLLEKYQLLSTADNSYDLISDAPEPRFYYGTWSGDAYMNIIKEYKRIYREYDVDFLDTQNEALAELSRNYGADALLIVGFNSKRTKAWVRCVDLRQKNLIWMQSNIKAGNPREMGIKISEGLSQRALIPVK